VAPASLDVPASLVAPPSFVEASQSGAVASLGVGAPSSPGAPSPPALASAFGLGLPVAASGHPLDTPGPPADDALEPLDPLLLEPPLLVPPLLELLELPVTQWQPICRWQSL
jgi:hypothetical protein